MNLKQIRLNEVILSAIVIIALIILIVLVIGQPSSARSYSQYSNNEVRTYNSYDNYDRDRNRNYRTVSYSRNSPRYYKVYDARYDDRDYDRRYRSRNYRYYDRDDYDRDRYYDSRSRRSLRYYDRDYYDDYDRDVRIVGFDNNRYSYVYDDDRDLRFIRLNDRSDNSLTYYDRYDGRIRTYYLTDYDGDSKRYVRNKDRFDRHGNDYRSRRHSHKY